MCRVQDRKRHSVEDAGPAGPGVAPVRLMDVFLRERERLMWIAAGMGMDRADADDVLQDVSVQVLKNEGRFEQENVMVRWLVTTTVNRCLTEHRRRFRHRASRILKRRPDMASDLAGDCNGADRVGLGEEIEAVRRTLAELDPMLLQAVVMRYFCEMKSHEIADVLEWNASTVRCRLREARLILARKLVERGIEP
ncbi:MAG: RNA polymerase sigma factor [Phycisphaerae bacterium]|nr:RNA polymerase sigma factor [Phycisphaerae bacterium]